MKIKHPSFLYQNKTDNDAFGAYLHGWTYWCLTVVEGTTDEAAKDVAMHCGNQPKYVSSEQVAKKKSIMKEY